MKNQLAPICAAWLRKIQAGMEVREALWGKDASESRRFFNGGAYDWLYAPKTGARSSGVEIMADDEELPKTSFRMSCNRVAEMVQLFGPSLYQENPDRLVTPREYPEMPPEMFGNPADPMALQIAQAMLAMQFQAQAKVKGLAVLLDSLLNYTPSELDLKGNSRMAIDEGIITGLGLLWTETEQQPGGGPLLVGSFWDQPDNLVYDPDATCERDAWWIARRCVHPVWRVEREYQLPPGSVRPNCGSYGGQPDKSELGYWSSRAVTADSLVYWKVYSKMGAGGRLQGVPSELRAPLDAYGDNCFMVVAEGVPYPLNLPQSIIDSAPDSEIQRRLQWPTPFWRDSTWPVSRLAFHEVPGQIWPMSHLKPAMGELKFLNWAYSFLAGRIKWTSRQFLALRKSLDEDTRKQIAHGPDLTVIELDQLHGKIDEACQFLQHPPVNDDLWSVIEAVNEQFDKRTGLTELLYGSSSRQLRSASEAKLKADQLSIRPDDMRSKVEDWMGEVAKKEAACSRRHLSAKDVASALGPAGAMMWQILAQGPEEEVMRQLQYKIEAGSTRRQNREARADAIGQVLNNVFAPLMQFGVQTGQVNPVNALLRDWAKSLGLNAEAYLLPQPMIMPQAAPAEGGETKKKEPAAAA